MAGSTYDNKHKWTNWRRANFEFFKDRLGALDTDLKLLDIGSGPEQFREVTWRFKNAVSVDFKQYGTTKIVADLTKGIPVQDHSVDIAFLSNVLEHLPDGRFSLEECYRILRAGGMIIGTVPFIAQEHQGPYDYHRYTHYMLEILLKDAGFKDIKIVPIGKPVKVYINITNDFFRKLKKRRISASPTIQGVFSAAVNILRLMQLGIIAACYVLYDLAEVNYQFVQGYGFVAYKARH
jgi:predicted SAM-dependent methyltransferase